MIYLLDTSSVSALMRTDARMETWIASVRPDDQLAVSAITRGEILFGLERLEHGRRRTELGEKAAKLFSALLCEPVSQQAADQYAIVKASQQRRGLPLDENDLWIAATALVLKATLVSRDSDFRAIEGLTLVEA